MPRLGDTTLCEQHDVRGGYRVNALYALENCRNAIITLSCKRKENGTEKPENTTFCKNKKSHHRPKLQEAVPLGVDIIFVALSCQVKLLYCLDSLSISNMKQVKQKFAPFPPEVAQLKHLTRSDSDAIQKKTVPSMCLLCIYHTVWTYR